MADRYRVLISDPLPDDARRILADAPNIEVIVEESGYEGLLPEIHGWIIRSGTKITAAHLEAAGSLKCVCRAGVGVDNIDLEAATRHGVVVMNTPDSNVRAAAEHTIAMLLSLCRNIPAAHDSMRRGEWERKQFVGVQITGKTLGCVGLGKVGRNVVSRAQGLGMTVLGFDPTVDAARAREIGVERVELEEMLPRVDFLALAVPLTPGTRGMIGAKELASCRRGIRIVNCSRGGVVDEEALLASLDAGHVGGAALDVYAEEPLAADSPLRRHPGLVLTPHLGASTREAQEEVSLVSAEQIRDCLLEGKISNCVNAEGLGR